LTEELKKDKYGFNPIYMMVNSGARGNKQQIRQLCGMRGLMAKPSGEIIELPITSNFREGLSVLEYFISTHGARKGLADTALKTADAGYFTRRLVDVAQDVVIIEADCGTLNGVVVEAIKAGDEIIEPLADRILGRVALDDIVDPRTGKLIVKANEEIDEEAVEKIIEADIERVRIRSVLTCETRRGVCAKCYGWNLSIGKLVDIGEAIGIIAAQSIGEPGTQLTMRTFHIGGTAYRPIEERELKLPYKVIVVSIPRRLIKLEDNLFIVYRQGELVIRRILFELEITSDIKPVVFDGLWVNVGEKIAKRYIKEENREEDILTNIAGMINIVAGKILVVAKERSIVLRTGTKLRVVENQIVEENTVIAELDPYNEPILTEVSGRVKFQDIVVDRTLREELDENTGLFRRVIVEDKEGKLQPRILIYRDEDTNPVSYIIPHGARLVVNDGDIVKAGDALAKFPQELIRTKDITGGLPRVVELFEARKPKNVAVVSEIDGIVKFKELPGGRRLIIIENPKTKDKREYEVSLGRHLRVHEGDEVYAGSQLTDGEIAPQDILRIKGEKHLQQYLLAEIQEVYRLQRVEINDKHIEVIIRQMLRKVKITDPGDTDFLAGELVDRFVFAEHNEEVIRRGGRPATARTVLLGITKASLLTDSFISSASFQETTRVLSEAAISGKKDNLLGLKENVIIGKLIPAGTGLSRYREVEIMTKDLFEELFSKPEEPTQKE
jgi:DNA-directed RNA polymerase subunit beta'